MQTQNHIGYTHQDGLYAQSPLIIHCDMPEDFECCWSGSGDFGSFRFIKTEIRSGFDVWMSECLLHQHIRFCLDDHPPAFSFNFCLAGRSHSRYGIQQQLIEIPPGKQGVSYCPDSNGIGCLSTDIPFRQLGITISPERLRTYFESHLRSLHPFMRDILMQKRNDLFCHIQTITPGMHVALLQLLNCPFGGMPRKLFFESRALELIAHQLQQLSNTPQRSLSNGYRLHPMDRKRTGWARDFLISNLEPPPGLNALARDAGMSPPKLNRCFREVFGMTVFEYLRNERLNQAREMLCHGFGVTETAYAVGYKSISHFSQAFKKKFGASPSNCVRGT